MSDTADTYARETDRSWNSAVEQPPNQSPIGRLASLPVVRSMPLVGAGTSKTAEEHIPLQDAVRNEHAIRRDDGSYIGVIEIEPANLATSDDDQWRSQIKRLSSVLMSNANGEIQIYSPMRSVDYGDRQEVYREQSQKRAMDDDDGFADVRADVTAERSDNVAVREQTTLSRTHYVIVSVSELDTTAQFTEDRGGLATVPVVGNWLQQREADTQKEENAHARAMCDKLTSRVERLESAIRGMDGVGARALSSVKATQVIDDHYGHDDAFAYDDYASLVRQAPLVYGDEDEAGDPEHAVTHDHPTHESVRERERGREPAAADGGAQAIRQAQSRSQTAPSAAQPERTLADVVHNESDALSDHYKSLLAAQFDTSDPGHVRIDDRTLTSTIAVRNWPRVPTYGMFSHILASSKAGVEIILSVQAERDETDDMDQKVLSLEQKWKKSEENESFTRDRDKQKYETAKDINETRKAPNKALFEVAAYITVKSRVSAAPEDMDADEWHNDTVASVKRRLQERPADAGGIRLDYNQMDGLHSSAPIAKDTIGETALMKDMGLASVYPWHAKNLTEPGGVVVGKHRERDEPTVLDIFNRETGYNIAVFGKIGSGKTTTVKQILTRHKFRNPDTTIAVIDPLRDFHGLTKFFDGERIVIGGDTPINPFRIESTPEGVLEDMGREIPFKSALRQAKSFVETYYQLEGFENYDERKGTWEKAIKLAYEWAGITEDPDTHDRPSPTVTTALWFIRDMANNPGNYVDDALEDTEKAKKDRQNTAIEIINNEIEPFRENGEYYNLTKQTDLGIEDGGFVYLDLQEYENDEKTGGLMMQLLISQIYEQTKSSPNPSVVSFDEARYMFQTSSNLGFLRQIVRHSRHYDLSMLFSTQQMGDFFEEKENEQEDVIKESAKDILDNTSMMLFHYLKEMNEDWAGEFGLTDAEHKFVKDAEPGERDVGYAEALLRVDREGGFPLRIEMDEAVNPREFALYRYDPQKHGEDLREYLRKHDDVCDWRWTGSNRFGSRERRRRRQEWADNMADGTPKPRDVELTEPEPDAGTSASDESDDTPPLPVTDVSAVDERLGASLERAGYGTAESVHQASNDELAAVDGMDLTKAAFTRRKAGKALGKSIGHIPTPTDEEIAAADDPPLTAIDGVQESRASLLSAAGFGTVRSVATADVNDLIGVDGFGEKRAAQVQSAAQAILDGAVQETDGGQQNE
jgi:hypothetical protein